MKTIEALDPKELGKRGRRGPLGNGPHRGVRNSPLPRKNMVKSYGRGIECAVEKKRGEGNEKQKKRKKDAPKTAKKVLLRSFCRGKKMLSALIAEITGGRKDGKNR